MDKTQAGKSSGSDTKSNRKRKPELDLSSVAKASKQPKGEGKKEIDCPECAAGRLNCPPGGSDTKAFCASCCYYWRKYICNSCAICFDTAVNENGDCPACSEATLMDSCPGAGKCDACGEHYSKEYPESTHVCLEEEEVEEGNPRCSECKHPFEADGVCWWAHNRCRIKCGKPRELCRCVTLAPDEEKMLRAFSTNAEFSNVAVDNIQLGPHWEKLLEHTTKVLKFVQAKAEAQRVLRAPGAV